MPDSPPLPNPTAPAAPLMLDGLAIDGAGLGCWEIDVATDIARYSRRWAAQLGYGEADLQADLTCSPETVPSGS